jgi:cell division protein DivIC
MKLLENYPLLKKLTNKYVLTGVAFVVWMIFLDVNNYFIHKELTTEVRALEADIRYYERELVKDRELLRQLETDPEAFERYVREQFGMLRPGEILTLIEFQDSLHE